MADLDLQLPPGSGMYPNIPTDSKGLIRKFQKNVELSYTKWKGYYKQIDFARKYALGRLNSRSNIMTSSQAVQEGGRLIKGNLIHATLQGLLPHIYAQNPEIKIRPMKVVEPEGYDYRPYDLFAQTAELVLNNCLEKAQLKRIAKQILRSCMTSKIGIVKVTYQRDYYTDPLISRQLKDAQSSLARMQDDIIRLQSEDNYSGDKDELVEEITNIIGGLEAEVDVMQREGLNLGFVRPEDFRMDTSLDSLQDYESAQWMANVTWMTPNDAMDRFQLTKKDIGDFVIYKRTAAGIQNRLTKDDATYSADTDNDVNLAVAVWEYWDNTTQTVYTWIEGGSTWIKEPLHPNKLGSDFFPYFILGLNWVDGQEWPISETELLMALQDEYNTIRTQMAKHRELSAPFFVADASRVNYEDIEVFSNARMGEIALINAGGQGVNQVFQPAVPPPMNPVVYDTSPIRSDMEWISGLGDAQRGGVMRSKTATEANIQQEGLATRINEKVDQVEGWLHKIAKYSLEILIQEMSPEMVFEVAGPRAFWPVLEMGKETMYNNINCVIKAGSTGMPDENVERMRWTEIMPIIMQNLQMIQSMRQTGIPDQFNPYIQLLEETLKRFDERIEIGKFLPPLPEAIQQWLMQTAQMQMTMGDPKGAGAKIQAQVMAPPQELNEAVNAPGNRVAQRTRNEYREPQGEI